MFSFIQYKKFKFEYNFSTYEMVKEPYKDDTKSFSYLKKIDPASTN